MNRIGFPVGYLMAQKSANGFRTGDFVRANVPSEKRQGVHAGRVVVPASGSFNVQTAGGIVEGVSYGHCRMAQHGDGYGYGLDAFRKKVKTPTHGTGGIAFLPAPKGRIVCRGSKYVMTCGV